MTLEQKIARKKKKFVSRIQLYKAISYSELPTTNIIVCNAGQATGLVKEDVHNLVKSLSLDIELPKFIAEKGESYSYVLFRDTESAIKFYNAYDAKAKFNGNDAVIYMIYVKDVPQHEVVCNYKNPQGLTLLEDFITEEEERLLIKLFDWTEEQSSNLKNRQVKHYGYEFRYGSNDVDVSTPLQDKIPDECERLWERLKEQGFDVGKPDQLTVNKYTPGQGIPSHVDKHSPFGSTILSLSLVSDVVMDWRHHSGRHVPVLVRARSMLVMQGEARYDWQHGIQPRPHDPVIRVSSRTSADISTDNTTKVITSDTVPRDTRISLTFRWTRQGPCECGYQTLCDSAGPASAESLADEVRDQLAATLEEIHVHQVYEQIAGHFSSTRHKPWPRVVQFMSRVPSGSVVVDLGAGNGKNMLNRNDILQIAAERSWGLLCECAAMAAVAAVTSCDLVRVDALRACLRDGCADVVICVAVIHHFSSRLRRLQAVSTIVRLLRPNGRALITVWAKDQTQSNYLVKTKPPSAERTVTIGSLHLPVHENRTQFQHQDLLVPWKLRSKVANKLSNQPESTLLRYYHVFEETELEKLCAELPDVQIEDSFYEEGNWCVVIKKI